MDSLLNLEWTVEYDWAEDCWYGYSSKGHKFRRNTKARLLEFIDNKNGTVIGENPTKWILEKIAHQTREN